MLHQKIRIKDGHTTGALVLFQQEIQKHCKHEGELEFTIDKLSKILNTDCPFREMLKKIIVLQVNLVSLSRNSDSKSILIDEPSMYSFCENLISKCGCVFFHNVETYYQCFQKKNYKPIQDIITEIVTKIISKYTSKAYAIFFSDDQKSSAEILDDALNTSISKKKSFDEESFKEISLRDIRDDVRSDYDGASSKYDHLDRGYDRRSENESENDKQEKPFMIKPETEEKKKDTEENNQENKEKNKEEAPEYHVYDKNDEPDELMSQF